MSEEQSKRLQILLAETKKNLEESGFIVHILSTRVEALKLIDSIIPKDASIGYGGSKTLEEIGFFKHFTKENYPNFLDRSSPELSPEMKREIQLKAIGSDYFLCSVNSLSILGDLVLIDKWGNRNAGATWGPRERIFVVSASKLALNLSKAIERASDVAAVENNLRFVTGNPCIEKGFCIDCAEAERLCSVKTIISRCRPVHSARVILIEEELGF